MKRLSIFLTLFLGITTLCGLTPKFNLDQSSIQHSDSSYIKKTLKTLQGTWLLETDSLAYLTVTNSKLTFHLPWTPTKNENKYNIEITDNYKPIADKEGKEIFLILTNKLDTMRYEIITLTEQKMSLMYYPSGNTYSYKKTKGKPKYDKSTKVNRYNEL